MGGGDITDDDWLRMHDIDDVDIYDFSERVGIILEDAAANPTPAQLNRARRLALEGFTGESTQHGHIL